MAGPNLVKMDKLPGTKMDSIFAKRVFTGSEWLENKEILIEEGIITGFNDAQNGLDGFICAGFIDLQVYGGNGILFSNHQTVDAIQATFDEHIQSGTTHFQITLNCSPKSSMIQAIQACKMYEGFGLIGLHLEGPFFNPDRRGAHRQEFVQLPNQELINEIVQEAEGLPTYMTIAPEMFSGDDLELLKESKIMLSIGHSDANYDVALKSINNGIDKITHLFNAMSPWQSRSLGLVGASFNSNAWTSIIVDGLHCDFESVKLAKKLKGDRLFLITDAVTNDTSGPYYFTQKNGRFTNDAGTLSGSSLTMIDAIKNCVQKVNIPLEEAIRMATLYPAEVAEVSDKIGTVEINKRAGLIHLNDELEVQQVWYDGKPQLN